MFLLALQLPGQQVRQAGRGGGGGAHLGNLHNNDESEIQLESWLEVTLIRAPGDFEESIKKREPLTVKENCQKLGFFVEQQI